MKDIIILLMIGVLAGTASGLVGIGGGVIIIPALVIIMGLSQKFAQGTTLAIMLPPISFFAVMEYYKKGYIDLKITAIICIGFVVGSFFGGKLAMITPTIVLKKVFAGFLFLLAIKYMFDK